MRRLSSLMKVWPGAPMAPKGKVLIGRTTNVLSACAQAGHHNQSQSRAPSHGGVRLSVCGQYGTELREWHVEWRQLTEALERHRMHDAADLPSGSRHRASPELGAAALRRGGAP